MSLGHLSIISSPSSRRRKEIAQVIAALDLRTDRLRCEDWLLRNDGSVCFSARCLRMVMIAVYREIGRAVVERRTKSSRMVNFRLAWRSVGGDLLGALFPLHILSLLFLVILFFLFSHLFHLSHSFIFLRFLLSHFLSFLLFLRFLLSLFLRFLLFLLVISLVLLLFNLRHVVD